MLGKHNLSYDNVEIDYPALLHTTEVAVMYSRDVLEQYMDKVRELMFQNKHAFTYAGYLSKAANDYAEAVYTYEAVKAASNRHHISIVNTPLSPEQEE